MGSGNDDVKTRSIRGVNVYGAYKSNTMTPWKNSRNEGREGDAVDKSKAKHWIDMPNDYRDKGTPDEWIPRDGRMVRLTGRHPFNCETPVAEMLKEGFFTPPNLHIIRNHGAVPKLSWETHKISIGGPLVGCETPVAEMLKEGFFTPPNLHIIRNHGAVPKLSWETHKISIGGPLVGNPFSLGMDQLSKDFPQTEFPVTISCCGNRRKEMNMIKQTIGFNWGIGAVATCIYRGVLLRDLLIHAGLDPLDTAGRYVEFIGTEDLPNKANDVGPFSDEPWGEKCKYGTSIPLDKAMSLADEVMIAFQCNGDRLHEPWGEKCKYGTSIPLEKAMSLADEVMIAFQCNGDRLHPDRGYPCRLIIPGYIGGRMIKWLAKINVIPHETHNHYHYWDNKYLPPQITAERAAREGWWYKQEYIINELSLNSVITYPNHGETLPVHEYIDSTLTLRGYAHSGGGRPVTRVEISTTKGEWWDLAEIHRTEKPNPYGKVWCWVQWTYELDCATLTDEIWVRAWDTSNSPQPENPVWTLMGQSANHVFRIKVQVGKTTEANGKNAYKFEHPTQPGQQTGGWATKTGGKFKSAGYGPIDFDEEQ
eukprot:CAMPEP_0113626184 /NCGR_PEP_ID=MMETSP0017_2-20120614/13539_1 /TAXON_ID=2856 /ORGANISM="Cylindrotheca closterium" /LENGTH=590 /DNA_ID=CAMNT_0000536351 /DNA_START=42 /DNA_END=1814 /DNA_ORIENTATION=+ /assembly_acc=CAM_ASM_000147